MNNYPAGVTGLEPQIAGSRERSETRWMDRECRFIEVAAVTPTGEVLTDDEGNELVVCDFMGGAEVSGEMVYGTWDATIYWTCPRGHDNETEYRGEDLDDRDPDVERY